MTLTFVDTSAMYNTYDGGYSAKSGVILAGEMNDSGMIELMAEKTPGGTAVGMQGLQ